MDESFEYTYPAPEKEEIQRIRSKYLPKEEETSMERLKRLDREAERPGTIVALTLGIVGLLVFGGGLSLCLVWELLIVGIPVGLLGIAMAGLAYPLYLRITQNQRKKLAPEILKLTEDLLKKTQV